MKDLQLDETTHDIQIPLQVVDGVDQVRQRLKMRLLFYKGEWFLDTTFGVPYYQEVFVKQRRLSTVEAIFKAIILGTPGVEKLLAFVQTFDKATRRYNLTFTVQSIFGIIEEVQVVTSTELQVPILNLSNNLIVHGV